jgi:hypothetical protein
MGGYTPLKDCRFVLGNNMYLIKGRSSDGRVYVKKILTCTAAPWPEIEKSEIFKMPWPPQFFPQYTFFKFLPTPEYLKSQNGKFDFLDPLKKNRHGKKTRHYSFK